MKKLTQLLSLSLALTGLGLAGCAAETATSEESLNEAASQEIETGTSKTLGTFDVGYGSISFHESIDEDGTVFTYVAEDVPADYASTPLDKASVTSTALELFMAVAPDEEAPESLVNAHPAEAKRLGRENADIIVPEFDQDAPIEKSSAWCTSWVFTEGTTCETFTHYYKEAKDSSGNYSSLYLTDDSNAFTTYPVTLGFCNDSSSTIAHRVSYDADGDSNKHYTDLSHNPKVYTSAGWARRYVALNMSYSESSPCTPTGNNTICVPTPKNTRYRIAGYASANQAYQLRTALTTVSHDNCIH